MAWAPDYITGSQLGSYMRLYDSLDDTELTVAASSASRAIDGHCNRQFGRTDAPEARVYTAWPNWRRDRWVIDIDDLQDATGLTVSTSAGAITLFTLEPVNAVLEGKVFTQLVVAKESPVQPTGTENEVTAAGVRWGWLAHPRSVVQAAYLQGSRFHSRRESPYGVAGSPAAGSELRLLSRLDADVAVALSKGGFVRPRKVA